MKRALLIAEKPSAAKAIEEAYKKMPQGYEYDIDFTSAAGHLVALFEPNEYDEAWGMPWKKEVLPIVPKEWKTKVVNAKFYNNIKEMWEKGSYDVVINAGDAGREAQLIQELIYESLGIDVPILRFWADEFTEKTVIKALNNLRPNEEYKGLRDASFLRMYFDWLLGMNYSRSTSLSLNRFVSIGRVMTPTLAMIVNREMEIKNFTPVPYYELEGIMKYGEDTFPAFLLNPEPIKSLPTPYAFDDRKKLEAISNSLGNKGIVVEVKKEEVVNKAPKLYNLSDLQKDMATKYRYSPAVTLDTAQSLYEKKYISYPRTESKCLTKAQAGEMKELLSTLRDGLGDYKDILENILSDEKGIDEALSSKKYVDDKKVQDHPALTVTSEIPNMEELSEKERNVYTSILLRLLSIFLPASVNISTSILIDVGESRFKATGTVLKEIGWKKLFNYTPEETVLPSLNEGDKVEMIGKQLYDKETKPPKRYNNATILDAMETAGKTLTDEELEKVLKECKGLGTAATRAEILEKLLKKCYIVHNNKGVISPTDQGIELINSLSGKDIVSPELTAKWEQKLKQVEDGTLSYDKFYTYMVYYVSETTKRLFDLTAIGPYHKVIGKCPKCKERDFLSLGSYYCCEGFLEKDNEGKKICDFALPSKYGGIKYPDGSKKKQTVLSETEVKNLISGRPTKVMTFHWSNGKSSNTALILTDDLTIGFPKPESLGKCPVCGGDVLKGKKNGGYYCVNAIPKDGLPAECDFLVRGQIGKTKISEEQVKQILSNGETSKKIVVKWTEEKSHPYPANIILVNNDQYGWQFAVKPMEEKEVCKCPYCDGKGTILTKVYNYECSRYGNGCDLRVQRKYMGADITEAELKKLLSKQDIEKNLKSMKTGNPYKATLFLEKVVKDGRTFYNINYRKK